MYQQLLVAGKMGKPALIGGSTPYEDRRWPSRFPEPDKYYTTLIARGEVVKRSQANGTPRVAVPGNNPHKNIDTLFQQV
jgi:hypothetical protein